MIVTNTALSAVSSILINKYTYDGSIKTSGSITIFPDGTATNFDTVKISDSPLTYKHNYVYQDNLELTNAEAIQVKIVGLVALEPSTNQIIFTLSSPDGDVLSCFLQGNQNNQSRLIVNHRASGEAIATNIIVTSYLPFDKSKTIDLTLNVYPNKATASIIVGANVITIESADTYMLNPNIFNRITIGNTTSNININSYWRGNIDLSKLFINKINGSTTSVYYSPSAKDSIQFTPNNIEFTSVMIAASDFPLRDDSKATLNKAVEFKVTTIKRTHNNLLLQTTIPEDVYLSVGSIGLYCLINGERKLFSQISGLHLIKSKNLPYELFFYVDLNINIVSTTIRPQIITSYNPKTESDIANIRRTLLHVNTDLERIVKANAKQIGFNTAQVFYKKEQALNLNRNIWTSASQALELLERSDLNAKSFYYIPQANKLSFSVRDMYNASTLYSFQIMDGSFKALNSIIDFSRDCSLVLKTNPMDLVNKTIINKINISNPDEKYFMLKITNGYLKFTLYMNDDTLIELPISLQGNLRKFLSYKCLLTITSSTSNIGYQKIQIFFNDTLIGDVIVESHDWINVSTNFSITNYTNDNLSDTSINIAQLYFSNLMYFGKTLTPSDIIGIQNLLECPKVTF